MKTKTLVTIIVVLSTIIMMFVTLTAIRISKNYLEERDQTIFTEGQQAGLIGTLDALTEQAIQCKQIPMEWRNYTFTLIAAECLEEKE